MLKKTPSNGLMSVDSLQKQVSNSISLFKTIKENLKNSMETLTAQINARDEEIAKLSAERTSLDELWNNSARVVDRIEELLA